MTSIADIRKLIAQSQIEPSFDNVLCEGKLQRSSSSEEKNYQIYLGADPVSASQCDKLWGSFNLNLIEFIAKQNYDADALKEIAEYIQLDDSHWDWLTKHYVRNGDEYEWFFLYIDNKPQAACLIYHPKDSAIDTGEIFYIEYVAVAPWNRRNPMVEKKYKGAGTEIIRCAMQYATGTLGLRYGFGLHALPKANEFYEKIGMTYLSAFDDKSLSYYEMSEESAKSYMGVS